jgi:hypothetical protein
MSLSPEEKKRRQEERRQERYNETHKEVAGIVYKKCTKHKEYFPNEDEWIPCTEEYFYKEKMNGTDGFNTYCKKCVVEKSCDWRTKNPERRKLLEQKYWLSSYGRLRRRNSEKRRRANGKAQEYQRTHKDKIKQYNKDRYNKNHIIGKQEWEDCKKYFDYKCAYCGFPLENHYIKYRQEIRKSDFHKEHVQHDGEKDLSNCIPACKDCNTSKWAFDMETWYRQQDYFSEERLNKIHKWLNEDYKIYIKPPKPKRKYVRKNINTIK